MKRLAAALETTVGALMDDAGPVSTAAISAPQGPDILQPEWARRLEEKIDLLLERLDRHD